MLEFPNIKIGDIVAIQLPDGQFSSPGIIIKQEFKIDGVSGGASATVLDLQHPFFSSGVVVPMSLLVKVIVSKSGDITEDVVNEEK